MATGANLKPGNLFVSRGGITGRVVDASAAGDRATLSLDIAAFARIGPHELRLATPAGASNALTFWIDPFHSAPEAEPNDDAAHAQPLGSTPTAIDGMIQTAGDVDLFGFAVQPGQVWVFECVAARIGSPLVPIMEVRDEQGNPVDAKAASIEGDPRLIFTAGESGRYFLALRDSRGRGGPEYAYRFIAGQTPAVTRFFPRGERPGRAIGLDLSGVNIGRRHAAVVQTSRDEPPGVNWYSISTPEGPTLPLPLILAPFPVAKITETDANMPLPLPPVHLDGVFERYPRTRFFFQGRPTTPILFRLMARSLGSPVAGAIRILNREGQELTASSVSGMPADSDRAMPPPDALLQFLPPAEAIYTVEAHSADGSTGADHVYRLDVQLVTADFRLTLGTDAIQVPAGGTGRLAVTVHRSGGFSGPVRVVVAGLPPGVTCPPIVVPAGQGTGTLALSAAPTTAPTTAILRVRGSATVQGRPVVREAVPQEPAASPGNPRPADLLLLTVLPGS